MRFIQFEVEIRMKAKCDRTKTRKEEMVNYKDDIYSDIFTVKIQELIDGIKITKECAAL